MLSHVEGFYECPDLFELPVDGNPRHTRWVMFGAKGEYALGSFDGVRFHPEGGRLPGDYGRNFYAAQTYSDIPAADGRRILIAWMNGGQYPGMPFNQQMSVPCELRLRTTADGVRLCRWPVRELERLRTRTHEWRDERLAPGTNLLAGVTAELLDVEADIDLGDAAEIALAAHGTTVAYSAPGRTLSCLDRAAPLAPVDGRLRLRLLVDRTSVEVFGNDGAVPMSFCCLPTPGACPLELRVSGGPARAVSLRVHELRSVWG